MRVLTIFASATVSTHSAARSLAASPKWEGLDHLFTDIVPHRRRVEGEVQVEPSADLHERRSALFPCSPAP